MREPTLALKARGEASRDRGLSIEMLVAVLLIPAVLGSMKSIFDDGDISWHIATGQWILAHGAIPHADPFSFTRAGKPWVPMEWLADLFLAGAYRLAGYAGISALVTAALMALHALVYANGRRFVSPLLPIVLMDFALIPMLVARPHVFVWPLLALWTLLMLRAREEDRAPPVAAALLMILWANLHASWLFGLALGGAFGLDALVSSPDRKRAFGQWLIFGAACVAAVFVNGNGANGVLYPFGYTHLQMLPLIDEWKPSSPQVTPFFFAVLAITAALIAWKRPRLTPVRWLLLAALVALALFQTRHQAMLAIVAAMILPRGFSAAPDDRRVTPVGVAVAGAALLLALRTAVPLTPPESETNPWKLIASVPPKLRSQPVLNGYAMGGPLILSGIRPYVDGRSDMYGDDLVVGYSSILGGNPEMVAEAVKRWNIRWAILPHTNPRLIALLDRSPGWRRIASDEAGVVYQRTG